MNFVDSVTADQQRRKNTTEIVRKRAEKQVSTVLAETKGEPEILIHLALGMACPFTLLWERSIWLGEIHRQ